MGFFYDPQVTPEPGLWLGLDEQERLAAILAWHEASSDPHPPAPKPSLHAAMHAVVENQIAANSPAHVGVTLSRLREGGLTRHEALHAIGSVVADFMQRALTQGGAFDEGAYSGALDALDPGDWRI